MSLLWLLLHVAILLMLVGAVVWVTTGLVVPDGEHIGWLQRTGMIGIPIALGAAAIGQGCRICRRCAAPRAG